MVFQPQAEALQDAQVIGEAVLRAKSLVDVGPALLFLSAEPLDKCLRQVSTEAVVVEQGIVDIEQENDGWVGHGTSLLGGRGFRVDSGGDGGHESAARGDLIRAHG